VITNRMEDVAYREALVSNHLAQTQMAFERHPVVSQMEKLVKEARAGLPADADDEALKAELEKRPEWKVLEEENARKLAEMEKTLVAAREMVRKRLEAEMRDTKAVAEGRAVPAPAGGSGKR
jgi:hypothetical protein